MRHRPVLGLLSRDVDSALGLGSAFAAFLLHTGYDAAGVQQPVMLQDSHIKAELRVHGRQARLALLPPELEVRGEQHRRILLRRTVALEGQVRVGVPGGQGGEWWQRRRRQWWWWWEQWWW